MSLIQDALTADRDELIAALHKALQAARPFVVCATEGPPTLADRAKSALTKIDHAMVTADVSTGRDFYT